MVKTIQLVWLYLHQLCFHLEGSPIACDCQNSWIGPWFKEKMDMNVQRSAEEEMIWICRSPRRMQGKIYHDLKPSDFGCTPRGKGSVSHCHSYDGSGVKIVRTTPTTSVRPTTSTSTRPVRFDEYDYSLNDNDNTDDDNTGIETTSQLDEQDLADARDLRILMGLEGETQSENQVSESQTASHTSSIQMISLMTLACIIVVGVVVVAVVYVTRKKRKLARDRMREVLTDLETRRASEPPPYQGHSVAQSAAAVQFHSRWDLPPASYAGVPPPPSHADPLGAVPETKVPLPDDVQDTKTVGSALAKALPPK